MHHFLAAFILVVGAHAAAAQQPVTLTTSADFEKGNNEGLIATTQDRVMRDRISAGGLGSWSASTSLPAARSWYSAAAFGGIAYVVGGFDQDYNILGEVLMAPLSANGSVGSWTSTTPLPSGRYISASVAYNGYFYVLGGGDDFGRPPDVFVAPINANGTLGSWTPATDLPIGLIGHASFAFNGFIYVVGGSDSNYETTDAVWYAAINADGSLGGWTSTTSLPAGRDLHSAAAYNGFVYAFGGEFGDASLVSDVLVAPLNNDGSLGSWTSTTPLPAARVALSGHAVGGFIYAIGGYDDNGFTDEVSMAPVGPDGSVGAWSSTTALPSPHWLHTSVTHQGYLYVFGGENSGSMLTDVVSAPITADANNVNQAPPRLRGYYSHLVDLQSDASNCALVLNGQLSPGGVVRLQVRLAPELSGVFGPETVVDSVALGTAIQVSGGGRYVWIRLTLDDTGTSDVDQATYISDITVAPFLPPATGVVNDGSGPDIDTQDSTSTIQANWSGFTASPGDPIAYYEWAIGSAPQSTNVQFWTNVGLATSATNSSLSLPPGMKFVNVRATSASGLKSVVATSDGVQVMGSASGPAGDDDDDKGRCESAASAAPAPGIALLAGLILLGAFLRRRFSSGLAALGILVVGATAAAAQQPVTLTTSADFEKGNNEGLVSTAQNRVTRSPITAGTVAAWASTTAMPGGRFWHACAAHSGFVYVIGGVDAAFTVLDAVLVAPILADGSLGSWSATTALPSARASHSTAAYNGYLYSIGGGDLDFEAMTEVRVAKINPDGSLDSWNSATSLPSARFYPSAFAYNGHLYSIGGLGNAGALAEVLVAPIRADGTLGDWTSSTALPSGRGMASTLAHDGRVYVLGGYAGTILTDVLVASLDADGTVESWSPTTSLPFARNEHSSIVHDGFIYVLGGYDENNAGQDDVMSAPIDATGALGSWTETTELPFARSMQRSIAHNGYLYAIGGGDDAFAPLEDAIVAPWEAGRT